MYTCSHVFARAVHRKLQYDTSLDDLVRQVFPRADDAARMEARQGTQLA